MQESKNSYQRETELRRAHEAQFLDDFKRAILLKGGHVASLGPEPVDEQLEICPRDPTGGKVRLRNVRKGDRGGGGGSSRLMAMKAAFSMADDEGEDNDDDDDEWDPLQVLKDSPDEFEEDMSSPHHAGTGSPEQKWKPAAMKAPPAPSNREEERAMLARAMR